MTTTVANMSTLVANGSAEQECGSCKVNVERFVILEIIGMICD